MPLSEKHIWRLKAQGPDQTSQLCRCQMEIDILQYSIMGDPDMWHVVVASCVFTPGLWWGWHHDDVFAECRVTLHTRLSGKQKVSSSPPFHDLWCSL